MLTRAATTVLQHVDVTLTPAGTSGWHDLRRAAAPMTVVGHRQALVASLDDLIRIRGARRAPADHAAIRDLQILQAVVEATERSEAGVRPRFPAHWDARELAHLDWLLERGRVRWLPLDRRYARGERRRTLTGFCS